MEQQVVAVQNPLHDIMHPSVYAQQLIEDIMDNVIERKHGKYDEEQNETHADEDRVRNYRRLRDEVSKKDYRKIWGN